MILRGIEEDGVWDRKQSANLRAFYDIFTGLAKGLYHALNKRSVRFFFIGQQLIRFGEGKTFLKTVHTDNSGNWSATLNGLSSGDYLTTTATDSSGNTSEFSTSWSAQGPAGIPQLTDNSAVYTIYPNPFAGYFYIKTADINSAPTDIFLYDMNGKMLDEFLMNTTEYHYNSELLKAGVYKILIKRSGKIQAVKMIVKR